MLARETTKALCNELLKIRKLEEYQYLHTISHKVTLDTHGKWIPEDAAFSKFMKNKCTFATGNNGNRGWGYVLGLWQRVPILGIILL